jgi:hypothetical protein
MWAGCPVAPGKEGSSAGRISMGEATGVPARYTASTGAASADWKTWERRLVGVRGLA